MTTPKERAHLLDLLNRTVDWPLVAVVDAIAEVINARDKAQAEEFRRLARGSCSQSNIARVMGATFSATLEEGKAEAYHKAAQMLEEKLNG